MNMKNKPKENLIKNVEKTCLEYLNEVDQVILLQSIYDTLIEIRNILEVKNEPQP